MTKKPFSASGLNRSQVDEDGKQVEMPLLDSTPKIENKQSKKKVYLFF